MEVVLLGGLMDGAVRDVQPLVDVLEVRQPLAPGREVIYRYRMTDRRAQSGALVMELVPAVSR